MKFSTLITVWIAMLVVGAVVAIGASTPSTPLQSSNQPTREVSVQEIRTRATTISYDQLAREPDKYKGTIVVFAGKVVQALETGQNLTLRVNVAADDWQNNVMGNIVYVDYHKNSPDEPRILEGDKVRFWGKYIGIVSYKAVLGQTIQIPRVVARIIEDQGRYVAPPFTTRR